MRLEKLPFVVVLLVGRVKPFKSIKSIVGMRDFRWVVFLKNENCEMVKLCDVFIWLGKFDF